MTARRLMPPWPPDSNPGEFAEDRRLTVDELGLLQQWLQEGMPEGNLSDLPPQPAWADDWSLGKPDLIVTMPTAYTLAAEGRDEYRNFVIPLSLTERRYVRGWEFHPGNPKIVHHAFLYFDPTRQSRRLANRTSTPGFPAMEKPDSAIMPEGEFMSYQPGKAPAFAPKGMAWPLEKETDLLLQIHMKPTGKPESLQASVGFYFTEEAPTATPMKILLTSLSFEILPGVSNYVVTDSFQLPVDVVLTAILPHAHYLAREIEAAVNLPNRGTRTLLHIPNWDFNWQGDYRFEKPIPLPAGAVLTMRYTYDNSTNNLQNPHHPPESVVFGNQSADEMAELWLQLLLRDPGDKAPLLKAFSAKTTQVFMDRCAFLLRKNPDNAKDLVALGTLLAAQGQVHEALSRLSKAITIDPKYESAYFNIGILFLQEKRSAEAKAAFETAVRLDPLDADAQGSLGLACLQSGQYQEALARLEEALSLNPRDTVARGNLDALNRALAEGKITLH